MRECQTIDKTDMKRQQNFDIWVIKSGMTKGQLAEKAGIHRSLISKIVRGERSTPWHIKRLIELGVPAEYLPEPNGRGQNNS
jgi:transcriptional regulator with XRE-family HTH domain